MQYSAATINAIDFRSPNPIVSERASARLIFSLHVLERASMNSPGIERSIDLIKQRLRTPLPRLSKRRLETSEPTASNDDVELERNGILPGAMLTGSTMAFPSPAANDFVGLLADVGNTDPAGFDMLQGMAMPLGATEPQADWLAELLSQSEYSM